MRVLRALSIGFGRRSFFFFVGLRHSIAFFKSFFVAAREIVDGAFIEPPKKGGNDDDDNDDENTGGSIGGGVGRN